MERREEGWGPKAGRGVMLKREGNGVCWEIFKTEVESLASVRGERFLVWVR